jgi:hypothetical protein
MHRPNSGVADSSDAVAAAFRTAWDEHFSEAAGFIRLLRANASDGGTITEFFWLMTASTPLCFGLGVAESRTALVGRELTGTQTELRSL